jgi:hypothetical protein
MPTGYTHAIQEGISFNDFVMKCARAFGALIEMRDAPSNAPIPEAFKPSDYHLRRIEEAEAALRRAEEWSDEGAEYLAKGAYQEAMTERNSSIQNDTKTLIQYRKMLEKVHLWEPPTPDHQGLKDFMIQQITDSIKWDCGHSDYYERNPITLQSGAEYRQEQIDIAKHDIEYHTKEYAKEIELTNGRNQWVKALRESLK